MVSELIAVMFGLAVGFGLGRLRDWLTRRDETRSVGVALYGEILAMREQIALVAKVVAQYETRLGDLPSNFAADYSPPDPILYPALAHKLGLLRSDLVIAITKFHASFRQAKDNLPLICREDKYHCTAVLRPAISAVEDIEPALRRIERLARLPEAAPRPDTGDAGVVIELAEEEARRRKAMLASFKGRQRA